MVTTYRVSFTSLFNYSKYIITSTVVSTPTRHFHAGSTNKVLFVLAMIIAACIGKAWSSVCICQVVA